MNLELTNRVVAITGGASGIGAATARRFLEEAAAVACWDIGDHLSAAVAELQRDFGTDRVCGVPCDITSAAAIAAACAETERRLGPIQHLVHAAAIGSGKFGFPFSNLTADDWRRVLEVNIQGTANVAHALLPRMSQQSDATVIFVASVAGQIGSQTDPPYSASKAANINFAQCLAKDYAGCGLRVNTVCPGMVKTPLNRAVWQAWHDQQPAEDRKSYAEWADAKVRQVVPLGRWQTAEDIADTIVFLSSARARQITGQTINVDGGFVMHW